MNEENGWKEMERKEEERRKYNFIGKRRKKENGR